MLLPLYIKEANQKVLSLPEGSMAMRTPVTDWTDAGEV